MGSKIGDYIHFYAKNYLRYGTTYVPNFTGKKGYHLAKSTGRPTGIVSPEKEMNAQIEKMKSQFTSYGLSSADMEILEQQLNFFSDSAQGRIKEGISPEQAQRVQDMVTKRMEELFPTQMGLQDFSMNNLTNKKLEQKLNAKLIKETNKYTYYKTIEDRLYKLANYADKAKQLGYVRGGTISLNELTAAVTKLQNEFNALTMEIQQMAQKEGATLGNYRIKAGTQIGNSTRESFITELNNLISVFLSPSSRMIGTYAELALLAMNTLMTEGEQAIATALRDTKNRHLGDNVSVKGLHGINVSTEFVDIEKVARDTQEMITTQLGNSIWNKKATQDKVDITVRIKDNLIPASIKNYNMSFGAGRPFITFLTGKSVIGLVQDYGNFVNHYLNIAAPHEGKYDTGTQRLESQIDNAKNAMKLTILRKAIEGGVVVNGVPSNTVGKSLTNELLIINDSGNAYGRIKVYSIGEIIDRVSDNINLLKTGDFDNLQLDNTFQDGPEGKGKYSGNSAKKRITKMIADLNAASLHVTVDKSIWSADFS